MCAALPQPVLSALPQFLNAYSLNRLHDVFTSKGLLNLHSTLMYLAVELDLRYVLKTEHFKFDDSFYTLTVCHTWYQ